MKKFYSLFLLMLFAIVGAGQAWATTYENGHTVNDYDLKNGDIVCFGATIVLSDFDEIDFYDSEGSYTDFAAETHIIGSSSQYSSYFDESTQFRVNKSYGSWYSIELWAISPASGEEIDDVQFSLSEGGFFYATFFSNDNWKVPQDSKGLDVEVLVISDINGNTVIPTAIASSGQVVEGGKPVLLKALSSGTVTINKSSETPNASYSGTNYLVGSDTQQTFNDDDKVYYILSKSNGVAGFYWQNGSNKGDKVVNGAHRASLWVSKSVAPSNVLNIRFDDTVTSISNIEKQSVSDTYYNMQGQRAKANSNGILIRNGQKFFVR